MIEFNPVWKGHYNMLTQIKRVAYLVIFYPPMYHYFRGRWFTWSDYPYLNARQDLITVKKKEIWKLSIC